MNVNEFKPNKKEMMAWIKQYTRWPHRMTGTPEGKASAEFTADTFRQLGLSEVEIEPVPSVCYETLECEINIDGRTIECHLANGTNRISELGKKDTKVDDADVVYLGKGMEEDFENVDVTGKIVICDCYFKSHSHKEYMKFFQDAKVYDPHNKLDKKVNIYNIFSPNDWPFNYLRAKEKGAAAFVGILQNYMDCHYLHEDYSDIIDVNGYMSIPSLWISRKDGEEIKKNADSSMIGSVHVVTEYSQKNALNVKGIVKGKSNDILLIHSHHDATCKGGVQDASGMSVVFALAKYFAALPKSERKTNIMFLSTDSHYTDYEGHVGFIDKCGANGEKIIMDLAVEHIGKAMELDENNDMILYDESETRQIYVSNIPGLLEAVYELVKKYDLEKIMLLPVEQRKEGEYKSGDVNSDAYDFHVRGIPVVSLIAAPMYIYHNSDDEDKVHEASLEPVAMMFIQLVSKVWDILKP
ncbi:MAG: M28 family peptidase [Firmicutes bacterium]|nr:M28 family peptidase [Bacillota bacterium]